MRIAYGVMGYGRGHASRCAAVLPALQAAHEVTVFAGGDAHTVLAQQFPKVWIPTLGYISVEGFIRDLARCRAVIATAGNVLIGEALYLRKPILALPEDAFEQRLNAWMVEQMGVGLRAQLSRFTPSDVDVFLGNLDTYRACMAGLARDSRAEAIETLLRYITELGSPRTAIALPPQALEASPGSVHKA